MKNLEATAIQLKDGRLQILDQRYLPQRSDWIVIQSIDDMVSAIQHLKVRGAPLIGVAASLSLALYCERTADMKRIQQAKQTLQNARPTAVNLQNCLDKLMQQVEQHGPNSALPFAVALFEEDQLMCQQLGAHGASLVAIGDGCLTCCNTGGLATAGYGTALSVLKSAHDVEKDIHVYAVETRPLLQGARLTTWECEQYQIPHTLICDNMAASLMAKGRIQKVFVGADRIAQNGDFANKIGTYSLAVLAKFHNIPFYCVAPSTTVDSDCPNGEAIPIEQRAADEVKGAFGGFGQAMWAPSNTKVYNPSFDVTPNHLVSGIILEDGVYSISEFQEQYMEKQVCGQ